MSKANELFAEYLRRYQNSGANSIADKVPELLALLKEHTGTKNNRAFLTDVLIDLKAYDQAIDLLIETSLSIGLTSVGYNLLAYCYWETNREALAYQAYINSLLLNPVDRSSLRGACFLATETDHREDAVNYCSRFHATSPTGREEILWYAIALWNSHKPELQQMANQLIDESDPSLHLRAEFDEDDSKG